MTHKPTAVLALPDLSNVIIWLENGCDPMEAANELRIYRERIDAALAAQPEESAHPTDGWVAVPREPTGPMIDAALANDPYWSIGAIQRIKAAYKAMLSAAPAGSAPSAPAKEEG